MSLLNAYISISLAHSNPLQPQHDAGQSSGNCHVQTFAAQALLALFCQLILPQDSLVM